MLYFMYNAKLYMYPFDEKAEISAVRNYSSEMILKCWFGAHETLSSSVLKTWKQNVALIHIFVETVITHAGI